MYRVTSVARGMRRLACVIGFIFAAAVAPAQSPEPADREYKTIIALAESQPPSSLPRLSLAQSDWLSVRNAELHERGLAFIARHPADPRRWEVLNHLSLTPRFTREVTVDGVTKIEPDHEAQRAWSQRYIAMVEELIAAPDASASAKQRGLSYLLRYHAMNWPKRINTPEGKVVLSKMERWYGQFERDYRTSPALINGARSMAEILDAADPARCERFLLNLQSEYRGAKMPDTEIRKMAEGRLKLLHGQAYPVWIRLYALDGRFADTTEYRGKLVLLALAPITLPAATELLQAAHAQHHAKGFEIIQVTTGDNMDRTAAKLSDLDVALLADERKYPWRVVYDRGGIIGDFARSLGLNAMPIYLLISTDGRFAAETSSGRELLKAIETEFKLAPQAQGTAGRP